MKRRRPADAVILDLDGTLWDSFPLYARLATDDDPRALERVHDALVGGSAYASVLLEEVGIDARAFRGRVASAGVPLFEGVAEAIAGLRRREIPLGVVTALPGWMCEPMLDLAGLGWLTGGAVAHRESAPRPKPHPDGLLAVLEHLAVEPSAACWMVGDTQVDCEAARRAGVSFAWCEWGYGAVGSADAVLQDPAGIVALAG